MALIKCPECGKEISDTCDTCIHCGYRLKEKSNNISSLLGSFESKSKPVKDDNEVIAYRGGAGGMSAVATFDIIMGAFFIVVFIIWVANSHGFSNTYGWAVAICFGVLALALFCLIDGIVGLIRISHNNSTYGDCITYNRSENMLTLTTIDGRKIKISPKQYVNIKCGVFSTDNILVIYYRNGSGSTQKIKLGFTTNAHQTKNKLEELRRNS